MAALFGNAEVGHYPANFERVTKTLLYYRKKNNEKMIFIFGNFTLYLYHQIKQTKMEKLEDTIKKQDEIIGRLTRENESLKESQIKRNQWLAQAKRDAGYSQDTSFDEVWANALPYLQGKKIQEKPKESITLYQFNIKNAQIYLRNNKDELNGFNISEILSIAWMRSKEDIMNDIITMKFD